MGMFRVGWVVAIVAAIGVGSAVGQAPPATGEPPSAAEDVAEGANEGQAASDAAQAEAVDEEPVVHPLVARGDALRSGTTRIIRRVDALEAERDDVFGEDLVVLEHQIADAKLDYLDRVSSLVDNVLAQEAEGLDAAELRAFVEQDLADLGAAIVSHIDAAEKELSDLRERREGIEGPALLSLEQRIAKQIGWLEELYRAYFEQIAHLEKIGLATAGLRVNLAERMISRADRLSGRIELCREKLTQLAANLETNPSDADLQAEIKAVEMRQDTLVGALARSADQLDGLTIDSSRYRQLLITTRGQVTADIFRGGVALGLLESWLDGVRKWARDDGLGFAFRLLGFVLIVLTFRVIAGIAQRVLTRSFDRAPGQQSRLMRDMLLALATRGFVLLGVLLGLSQMGVELGPLLAGLGIAGFIVGFALQDSLSNFAAGAMILAYRPFDVDDLVEAGSVFGRVSHMSLVSTTILTLDNQTLIVPNARIWGDVIKNVTNQKLRRVDMTFALDYDADTDRAEEILRGILADDGHVLEEPEPLVKLHKLREGWVEFAVRPWVDTENYWETYWFVTREAKRRFGEAGLSPGIPRQDVRFHAGEG